MARGQVSVPGADGVMVGDIDACQVDLVDPYMLLTSSSNGAYSAPRIRAARCLSFGTLCDYGRHIITAFTARTALVMRPGSGFCLSGSIEMGADTGSGRRGRAPRWAPLPVQAVPGAAT